MNDDHVLRCLGSFANLNQLAKAKAAQPGEVHQRGGDRYQKQPGGGWKKVGGGAAAAGHKPSAAPESIDYHEEDPRRRMRAMRQAGRDHAEDLATEMEIDRRHREAREYTTKAKRAQPGEIHQWGGDRYKKSPDGKWIKLPNGEGGGGGRPRPEAPKTPKPSKDRQAQVLVGRYIESRHLGDAPGSNAIMRRLKQVVPHEGSRRKMLMQFGDPDHPQHGEQVRGAARAFLDTVPTDEMVSVMRRVP